MKFIGSMHAEPLGILLDITAHAVRTLYGILYNFGHPAQTTEKVQTLGVSGLEMLDDVKTDIIQFVFGTITRSGMSMSIPEDIIFQVLKPAGALSSPLHALYMHCTCGV